MNNKLNITIDRNLTQKLRARFYEIRLIKTATLRNSEVIPD